MKAKFISDILEGVGDKYALKRFGIKDELEDFETQFMIFNLEKENDVIGHVDNFPIIKNPKSLKNFPPDIRGIMRDGTLYLIPDALNVIHTEMLNELKRIGIIHDNATGWEDTELTSPNQFIAIQRVWTKNVFSLSDSYVVPRKEGKERELVLQRFEPFLKNARKRHPQFEFVNDKIRISYKNLLNPIERIEQRKYNLKFFNESIGDVLKPKSQSQIQKDLQNLSGNRLMDIYTDTNDVKYLRMALKKKDLSIGEYEISNLLEEHNDLEDELFPLITKHFIHKLKPLGKNEFKIHFGSWGVFSDLFKEDRNIDDEALQNILDGDAFDIFNSIGSQINIKESLREIEKISPHIDEETTNKFKSVVLKEASRHTDSDIVEDLNKLSLTTTFYDVFKFVADNKHWLRLSDRILCNTINETQTVADESAAYTSLINTLKSNFGWKGVKEEYDGNSLTLNISKENIIKMFKMNNGLIDKININQPQYGWNGDIEDFPEVFKDALRDKINEINPNLR